MRIQESKESSEKVLTVRRKSSTIKTVLPTKLEAAPMKGIASPRLDDEELREMPRPITNLSRRESRRGEAVKPSLPTLNEKVKVLYDFTGENDGEMSIKQGATVIVTRHIDEGWWYGKCDGQEGMFPANYVKATEKSSHQEPRGSTTSSYNTRQSNDGGRMPIESTTDAIGAAEALSRSVADCKDCGCNEFTANVFKPGKCNNCFHVH